MKQPTIFREERRDILQAMIAQHPFASMVTMQEGDMVADHLPLMIHPELSLQGTLRGHISRGNPINKKLDQSFDALVMFQGLHHYVSPSWYPSKQTHGMVVPTWNYIVVQVRGKITLQDNAQWLLSHLSQLTDHNEKTKDIPWKVADAPDDYIAKQLRGIVGVEIEISSLQGTWKMSQNKSEKDREGVSKGLMLEGSEMARNVAECVVECEK